METYLRNRTYKVDWFYDVWSAPSMDYLLFIMVLLPTYVVDPELPMDKDGCESDYRV